MTAIDELVEAITTRMEPEIVEYMIEHIGGLPDNEKYTKGDVTHFVVASMKVAKLYEKARQAHTTADTIDAMTPLEWRRAAKDYERLAGITGISLPHQLAGKYLALERRIILELADAVDGLYPNSRVKGEELIKIMSGLPVIAGVLGRLDATIGKGVGRNYLDSVEISINPNYKNAGGKG